jgi:hypothetical protein
MMDPTDQEALAKVNEALEILGQQLATAEATYIAAQPRLAAAEAVLAPLLAEQRQGTETASAVGAMPVSGGGYVYQASPLSNLAQRIERAQQEYEEARLAALQAGTGVNAVRVKIDHLRRAQRTLLERLGPGGRKQASAGGERG